MTADLSIVPGDDEGWAGTTPVEPPEHENRHATPAGIPDFEGKSVTFTKAKITSTSNLEIDDRVFRVDEYVRMEIEGRVVDVAHKVNDRTGDLERVHTIKAIDSKVLPWEIER